MGEVVDMTGRVVVADELDKALKSVTGLGESASKVWGKLFGGD